MHEGCVVEAFELVNIRNKPKLLLTNLSFYTHTHTHMHGGCVVEAFELVNIRNKPKLLLTNRKKTELYDDPMLNQRSGYKKKHIVKKKK
jgi:hypothetical protein